CEFLAVIFLDDDLIQHRIRIGHADEVDPQRSEVEGFTNRLELAVNAGEQPRAAAREFRSGEKVKIRCAALHIVVPRPSNAALVFGRAMMINSASANPIVTAAVATVMPIPTALPIFT